MDPDLPLRRTLTQHDTKIVTQKIQGTEQDLKRCNAEINRLKGALLMLEKQRSGFKERLKGYRSLLAPINRMPPEVLLVIFKLCSSEINHINRYPANPRLYLPPPIRLAMVCGRWRELVISTPSLWSGLKIEGRWKPEHFPNMLRALELFIHRSKSHPLTLEVIHNEDGPGFTKDVMETLVPTSDRWESLDLFTDPRTSGQTTLHPIRGRLSNLRRLALRGPSADIEEVYDEEFCHLFELAPSLRSISLQHSLVTSRLSLPWQHLAAVSLGYCPATRIRQILSLTPNVECVKLNSVYPGSDLPDGRLTLPKLSTFSATIMHAGFVSDVFQRIDLPNLRGLVLFNILLGLEAPWDISALTSTLRAHSSASSLTSLSLRWMPVSDGDMISLLQLVPTLTTLIVCESRQRNRPRNLTITTPFLRQLSYPDDLVTAAAPDAVLFLPRLMELKLDINAEGLDQRALVYAILSRSSHGVGQSSSAGSCLRSTDITVVNGELGKTFDILRSLECLVDTGMDIHIQAVNEYVMDEEVSNGEAEDEDDE